MNYIFGPCTITFNGSDIGKTNGGGKITITTTEVKIPVLGDVLHEESFLYGEGELNKFEISDTVITDSMVSNTYGELILTGDTFQITIPSCKLLLPKSLDFGTNDFRPYTIRFFFKQDLDTGESIKWEAI